MIPMDIYAKPGTKVYFLGENGYEGELNVALKTFPIGHELTVSHIDVGSSISYVYFKEFPHKSFNTVMFSESNPLKKTKVRRMEGWQTSDERVWKSEERAIQHQQYLDVMNIILKMAGEVCVDGNANRAIASHLAENRSKLYEILKDNV